MQAVGSAPQGELSPKSRIALAYAPRKARPAWAALLLLEQRLAEAARPGRDPIMVQLRLSWWRDRLAEDPARWPVSEPVFAHLPAWDGQLQALTGLVDGYEALVAGDDCGMELPAARLNAYCALATLLGARADQAVQAAVSHINDANNASRLPAALPRSMRPLAVLRAFALREAKGGQPTPFADLARIILAGMFGR